MDDVAARPPLTMPRVAVALVALLTLALVLPYAAVRRLHQGRLDAADRQGAALAQTLAELLRSAPGSLPPDVELLEGPGARPAVLDDRWTAARTLPLVRVLRGDPAPADPWGNAYLVFAGPSSTPRQVWVLTAGPDGIVQTPFPASTPAASAPAAAGDDRFFRVQ